MVDYVKGSVVKRPIKSNWAFEGLLYSSVLNKL